MTPILVAIPLLLCLGGALCAALHAHGGVSRRASVVVWGWILAGWSAAATGVLAWIGWGPGGVLESGVIARASWSWVPAWDLCFSLRVDGLGLLMGLLVCGVGSLVMGYAGHYFSKKAGAWRFLLYMMLFQVSMLGVVLAGDLLTLFIFWELTSITSFLLIAYDTRDPKARRGALKALVVTGGGGVALFIGLLVIAWMVGGTDLDLVLSSGELVRGHDLYGVALGLVALGAFTKSAQVPFQGWLPDGMTAPTPASAYLHSATMVKAGVFLLARLHPALGHTAEWFWLLTSIGLVTMLHGGITGLRARDLKALLAASTIGQLGALTMLVGQGTATSFKALTVGLLAHGMYKSALFMVVGIVDHETGTRDLGRLGGLARAMPATLAIAILAGLSMAGLPPLFGYLAKDALVVSAAQASGVPSWATWAIVGSVVVAGAMIAAQAGILVWDTFLARPRSERAEDGVHPHDPPWGMLIGPGVPAVLGIIGAVVALPTASHLAASAGSAAFGSPVDVTLKFWKGFDATKALGVIAMVGALVVFLARRPLGRLIPRPPEVLFPGVMGAVDLAAYAVTRLQNGQLHRYLLVMFAAMAGLIVWRGLPPWPGLDRAGWEAPWPVLRVAGCVLAAGSALAVVFLKRDLFAILALGASGLGVSMLFLIQPAPDVALVMIVADVLTMVILVLALLRVPAWFRRQADRLDQVESPWAFRRDGVVAVLAGAGFAFLALFLTLDHPRESAVSPWYLQHSKTAVSASDVVAGILVDFRALDTLIEITVFALAGAGVYSLLRHASPAAGDRETIAARDTGSLLHTPLLRMLAQGILPLAIAVAATHIMYGHAQPGDGFTAGVILCLTVAFRHVVLGYERSRRSKPWLRPLRLVGAGLGLAIASATIAFLVNGSFFSHVNFGESLGIPLPRDVALTTSLLFDAAIAVAVMGGGTLVINTLSGPKGDAAVGEGGHAWKS
ncbi:MAG: DUF4040 domain-containing protein [Phycisphaeraceae bacterium]|nr:DUF4040 domain-containing protein [Phycisphaeraceae bacterium]